MVKRIVVFVLAVVLLAVTASLVASHAGAPVAQSELADRRIYAYRDWQSAGVRVNPGDQVRLRSQGTWLYTPDEYHGPAGHPRYAAPSFYPYPGVRGGVLLGRIGEKGQPFVVGDGTRVHANEDGMIFLRINDDILSDNDGYVTVDIEITPADSP